MDGKEVIKKWITINKRFTDGKEVVSKNQSELNKSQKLYEQTANPHINEVGRRITLFTLQWKTKDILWTLSFKSYMKFCVQSIEK